MLDTAPHFAPGGDFKQAILGKLLYACGKEPAYANSRDWYCATALAIRDCVVERWHASTRESRKDGRKLVYYLSMEFLIGRLLTDTVSNLGLLDETRAALAEFGVDFDEIREVEPDAGLGNGGLGRLAACFMESMATVGVAGFGYGIRYDHGLFRQSIRDGWQVELPENWLDLGNPWEFERGDAIYEIGFGGQIERLDDLNGRGRCRWRPAERVLAVAFDTPAVGWRGTTVNTLRLWSARALEPMRLDAFNRGEHVAAFAEQLRSTAISRVLYPDDSSTAGQELRLRQEYFFTSASLQDMVRRHISEHGSLESLPDKAAVQLNDTHPALAVIELARLLVDEHGLRVERAFDIVRRTLSYTNHTLLPEALETWPVPLLERLLPRHMQLIYLLNADHLAAVRTRPDFTLELMAQTSLIDERDQRRVRMGHLAFLGSRKVNGVSALHGELVRKTVFRDLHNLFPDRITHITNGITFRRWLVESNPGLTELISCAIGDRWIEQSDRLGDLKPFVDDVGFLDRFAAVKLENKQRLAALVGDRLGLRLDPGAMFDVQIKRIHEYKRQLMNILETVAHYRAIRAEPSRDWVPRVKIFAGKAAAGYYKAKLIIKLINDVARVVNSDPLMRDRLRVVFLPDYNVSLAEKIIPAADLSEQISTAGMEASGTGNLKLALNGAITIGTLDGANVEIRDCVGRDNILIFGLTADQVEEARAHHHPRALVEANPTLAETLTALRSGAFSPDDWHRYGALVEDMLNNDYFLVTADFAAYAAAQRSADDIYADAPHWRRMSMLNTVGSGWFSSDRTICEYAKDIWRVPTRNICPE